MDVRCERCKKQYEVDDARVTEAGVTVQCTQCQHTFIVKKKALVVTIPVKPGEGAPPTISLGAEPPPPPAEPPREREWRVRQGNGNVFGFKEMTALQRWIVERKVTRDDEISADGQTWMRLGNIPELAGFFLLVDEAGRAAELQVQARLGMIPGTNVQGPSVPVQPGVPGPASEPSPPATPPSPPPVAPPLTAAAPPFRAALSMPGEAPVEAPKRSGGRWLLPLGLLALLGAAGAGVWFLVLQPREQAAARAQAEQREALRLEQERLAKAEADARANTSPPAGMGGPATGTPGAVDPSGVGAASPSQDDGGSAADGGPVPDAGEVADAGATVAGLTPDAGPDDAGTAPDAGAADAGTPLVDAGSTPDAGAPPDAGTAGPGKRPEPARDFDSYLAQGDRLRERERADPAMAAYDKASELAPERAEPYAGRGLVHLDLGDYSLAEAEFLRALQLNPRYGVALMGLAETYRSQGKKAEAIRYYERYLDVLPDGPEAAVARSALQRLRE